MRSGVPKTISAIEVAVSILGAFRRPSLIQGRDRVHDLLVRTAQRRASFNVQWNLSTMPFDCGWQEVMELRLMPRWVRALRQASEVNCVPRLEVMVKVAAETRDPALDESLDDRLRRCVRDWDSFRPAGGSVDHRQEVFKPAVWRERAHDINMNMAETCWRDRDREDGRVGVSGDLVCSAGVTLSCPAKYVAANTLPSVWFGDDRQGRLSRRMGQVLNRLEDLATPNLGDENLGPAKRRVAHNCAVDAGETDMSELEQGSRFFVDGMLFLGQVGEVNVREHVSNGVNDGRLLLVVVLTRQGIHNDVFEARDVRDVRLELADKRKLVALPIRDGVTSFKESASERLLVREYAESAAFEDVSKLHDRAVNRWKFQIIRRVAGFGFRWSTEKSEGLKTTVDGLVDRACNGPGARVRVDA